MEQGKRRHLAGCMIERPSPVRCLALLTTLHERHGPQVFGQQMQRLLAHTFRRAGYSVTGNAVGVPDFVASKGLPPIGYAVEVKTGTTLTLSERELEGIRTTAHVAVVAALIFPDDVPRWLFIDGRAIEAGQYRLYRLAQKTSVQLDFEANDLFAQLLADFYESAFDGAPALELAVANDRVSR